MRKNITSVALLTVISTPVLAEKLEGSVEAYIDDNNNAGIYSSLNLTDQIYVDVEVAESNFGAIGAGYTFNTGTGIYAAYVSADGFEEARLEVSQDYKLTDRLTLSGSVQYRNGLNNDQADYALVHGDDIGSHGAVPPPITPNPHKDFYNGGQLPAGEHTVPDIGIQRTAVDTVYKQSQMLAYNVGVEYALNSLSLSYDYDYYQQLEDFYGAEDAQSHTAQITYTGSKSLQPYVKYAVDGDFSNGLTTVGLVVPF